MLQFKPIQLIPQRPVATVSLQTSSNLPGTSTSFSTMSAVFDKSTSVNPSLALFFITAFKLSMTCTALDALTSVCKQRWAADMQYRLICWRYGLGVYFYLGQRVQSFSRVGGEVALAIIWRPPTPTAHVLSGEYTQS